MTCMAQIYFHREHPEKAPFGIITLVSLLLRILLIVRARTQKIVHFFIGSMAEA